MHVKKIANYWQCCASVTSGDCNLIIAKTLIFSFDKLSNVFFRVTLRPLTAERARGYLKALFFFCLIGHSINPRPDGGLSHLRHGGGGGQNDHTS